MCVCKHVRQTGWVPESRRADVSRAASSRRGSVPLHRTHQISSQTRLLPRRHGQYFATLPPLQEAPLGCTQCSSVSNMYWHKKSTSARTKMRPDMFKQLQSNIAKGERNQIMPPRYDVTYEETKTQPITFWQAYRSVSAPLSQARTEARRANRTVMASLRPKSVHSNKIKTSLAWPASHEMELPSAHQRWDRLGRCSVRVVGWRRSFPRLLPFLSQPQPGAPWQR